MSERTPFISIFKPRHAAVEAKSCLVLGRGREVPTARMGGRRREPFRAERRNGQNRKRKRK